MPARRPVETLEERIVRALLVLTSHTELVDTGRPTGYYVPEAAHPWSVFRDAGIAVDLASPQGGAPRPDGLDPDDAVQSAFLADPEAAEKLAATIRLADVEPSAYDAVLFVGNTLDGASSITF